MPSLELTGGTSALRENIKAYLDIEGQSCRLARWHVRALGQELDRKIDEAARALGYYHLSTEKSFERTEECWRLSIVLNPGPAVVYDQVNVVLEGPGADNQALTNVRDDKTLREGRQFNHGRYDAYKSRLLQVANTQGYFDAEYVRAEVLVSRERNTARVNLILDTGERYRIGEVSVEHDILSDELIDRYITLERGQEYRSEELVKLKSELQASHYFGSVSVEPQLNSLSDGEVPINIKLIGGPKHSYSIGAGYASDTGPRILLGYENRYLNSAGHSLDANVNASEVITTYQVGYSIPMKRPAYEVLRLYTGFSQEDINKSVSNRLVTGANYSRWETSSWLNNLGLSYEEEEYSFGEDPSRTSELVIPMYSTSYTSVQDVKYPRSGWNLLFRVKGASDAFVSSTDFAQVYGRAKLILPLGEGRLLFRGEGGITEVDDFNKLPISQRFFAGGDASVRGYDYKTLGPKNDDDIVIGGSRLLTGSIEYDRKVYGDFVLAAFYDEGTAFNKGYLEPYRGVGVGIRWVSPVGPVRADVAKALDGDEGWRLHFSVGPDL
ncbi:autotransporter assembly complex protein TamA [Gilvimarinus algae]|uniref:Translocation and assembly module subunit TamA n=1 Tax=Gilvimarinus algae TaxID=3058037 RepID=A0ABT8TBV5_9GAMM|nr:autotransporter assembly complex family protein [Gilvimarinus sp. SDUM040014]MDO3380858.1 autotransporter assembly complex family protein [Gilvimarinus sp. SDUM040014]